MIKPLLSVRRLNSDNTDSMEVGKVGGKSLCSKTPKAGTTEKKKEWGRGGLENQT